MRIAYFGFVLALLSLPAAAQNKKNAPAPSSTSILINGQPINGKVLEMDGRHYMAVEDLAQSLRGTIAYGDGRIAITLPELPPAPAQVAARPSASVPPQLPAPAAQPPSAQPPSASTQASSQSSSPQSPSMTVQPSQAATIKGTLTYFVDFHAGNKPDAGSKVWLVKGRVEIPPDQTFVATSAALGTATNPEQYPAIAYSIADEKGNFELRDVPPGEYTIILQSAHTVGTLNEKRNFFGRGNGRTARDSKGRLEFRNLQIKPGEAVNASKDFGPNIDM
ncbi:MAG: carboxypeptidase-like regulatory domain-containing protein [Acidobacteriia bacterium]|nr:carboxypeptidase-like regulatory domain-containing protein [Terriglobia bacterium]